MAFSLCLNINLMLLYCIKGSHLDVWMISRDEVSHYKIETLHLAYLRKCQVLWPQVPGFQIHFLEPNGFPASIKQNYVSDANSRVYISFLKNNFWNIGCLGG